MKFNKIIEEDTQQIIDENRAKGKAIKEKLRDKLTFIGK